MGGIDLIIAEGRLDAAVGVAIVKQVTGHQSPSGDSGGSERFWRNINRYNEASRHQTILALADFDRPGCVGPYIRQEVPTKSPGFILRLAVRELESWLMADHVRIGEYLGIDHHRFPREPDRVDDPKTTLVNLCRKSNVREIREGMCPPSGMTGRVGRLYSSFMEEFIQTRWRPKVAAKRSPSLARAIRAVRSAARG